MKMFKGKHFDELGSKMTDLLDQARATAFTSAAFFRHGALLFKGSRVIKAGCNQYRAVSWPNPTYQKNFYDAEKEIRLNNMHAETSCMHNVNKDLISGADVLVCRVNARGEFLNSKPCIRCNALLISKNIRRAYFTTGLDTLGLLNLRKM
jgi:deoxycytidylate deaminase